VGARVHARDQHQPGAFVRDLLDQRINFREVEKVT
jgi:hypothetical protein